MSRDPKRDSAHRSVRILVGAICITGLILPAGLGLAIRCLLAAKGVSVVSLAEGAQWVVPLTFVFFLPFGLFALIAWYSLGRAGQRSQSRFRARLFISSGVLLGMTAALGYVLIHILQTIKGVADAVAFWPFTIAGVFLWAIGGGMVGAIFGWIAWHAAVRRENRRSGVPGNNSDQDARR